MSEWGWNLGDIDPGQTIIMPVGKYYDKAGLIRAMIFGLKLVKIARGEADDALVEETLEQYKNFCTSLGVKKFHLSKDDILTLATSSDPNKVTHALNMLIKSLPLMPLNSEEIKEIYEHAREALIRA